MNTLYNALRKAGWDPLHPSQECIDATKQPPMGAHLSELDRVGIHRRILSIDILRRFYEARGEDDAEDARTAQVAATLLALRAAGHGIDGSMMAVYQRWDCELDQWHVERFVPSDEAWVRAVKADKPASLVSGLEPAHSYSLILHAQGWTDFEGNRKALARALQLVERRGVVQAQWGGLRWDMAKLRLTDDDVGDILELMTRSDPGRRLYYTTAGGQFRLGASEARDALESEVGAVEPVSEQRAVPVDDMGGFPDTSCNDVTSAEAAEAVALIRRAVAERLRRAGKTSPNWHVLAHFEDLKSGRLTYRALARDVGMPESTIRDAANAEARAIRGLLRAG